MSLLADQCRPVAVVTGYWPPTNEMLRPWSEHPLQNPDGWQGDNWRGLGYDVFAYFPEFPPDGDPTNDKIGDPGSVGSPDFDFQVDYQATSRDFWRIMDAKQPRVLITTSRGGDIGWELEAVEGGHGQPTDWASDKWGQVKYPLADSVDPRTTNLLQTHANSRLESGLPLQSIARVSEAKGLAQVAIDHNTSGNYLSGFMGLHGLHFHYSEPQNVAAGHIHVGRHVKPEVARALFEVTLETVLKAHPPKCSESVTAKME
ncbi:MAG: hypothetical protein AAF541_18295 [Pseudomonadota bacterium]